MKSEQSPTILSNTLDVVNELTGVTPEEVLGRSRYKPIPEARHVAMYLIWTNQWISLKNIGRMFDRDHSTVIHAINKIEWRLTYDRSFNVLINKAQQAISNR